VPIARLAVAICALLVLTGCAVGNSSKAAAKGPASPTVAAERSEIKAATDVRTAIGKGLLLTATAPRSFTPTDTAYPRVHRAVAIDMTVDNSGSVGFRPSQLTFSAAVDGTAAEQVIDSTQGYNGVSGATDEVVPGQSLRFTVAFAVPDRTCAVRVTMRPDPDAATAVELYDGVIHAAG
jgi:hypothetical protein